jgi:hypothetical protein
VIVSIGIRLIDKSIKFSTIHSAKFLSAEIDAATTVAIALYNAI